MRLTPPRRTAFTMIELIIVIVVLGLLASIGVLAYTSVVTTSQDRAASLALTDVAREASALAAQNGESEWSEDDFATALADSAAGPALSGGVSAAGKLALVNTAADSINSSSMAYGQVSLQTRPGGVAGLAMKTQAGHCVFVRAVLPQQITAWKVTSDLGGNCLASVGLATGPSGTYTYAKDPVSGATPLAPANLTATLSGSTVQLAWSTVSGAATYTVYRSTDGGSSWTTVVGPQTATTYADTAAPAGLTSVYAVTATGTNESPKSATAAVTLQPAAPTASIAASGTAITVSWPAVPGAGSYAVFKDGGTTTAWTGSATTWTDSGLANGSAHSYTVTASNSAGTSAPSAAVSATAVPSAVASVTAAVVPGGNTITVSWPAATGATSYQVTATANTGGTQLITAPTTTTTFTLNANTVTQFTVAAGNGAGWSPTTTSNQVTLGYAGTVMAEGPIDYWRLNDASGSTAADKAGTDPGTFSGGYTLGQAAAPLNGDPTAKSTSFDGSTGHVSIGSTTAGQFANGLSVSAWVYPTANSSYSRIVEFGAGSQGAATYLLTLTRTGTTGGLSGHVGYAGGFYWVQTTNTSLMPLNTWTHVTMTVDTAGTITIYVNGVAQATTVTGGTKTPIPQVARTMGFIGHSINNPYSSTNTAGDVDWAGRIAEVAVWNRPLAAGEVQMQYNLR